MTPAETKAPVASPRDALASARRLLAQRGEPDPVVRFAVQECDVVRLREATQTALMDLYRRSGDRDVFERLVAVAEPALGNRVRLRLRCLRCGLDPGEVLQDVLINVYRYPDRFDGSRAGAFRAWSSTIVDNTIRRHLRRQRTGVVVQLQPNEVLTREADATARNPSERALQVEACARAISALRLLLVCYLDAYHALSERERFVLQMVEVRGMRYGELAKVLGIRPEALKMVVFRARRRIYDRMDQVLHRTAA
jgi:RNA polymerase sigma factor (sigma-70 family)